VTGFSPVPERPSAPLREKRARPTDELTTKAYWESAWSAQPRWRLPSRLVVATRNIQRILGPHVSPGIRVLELGCAPGKMLAWVAAARGAHVAGLDYSEQGIGWSRRLFETLGLCGDLRCEDVFQTTFEPDTVDLVYSCGLIEHFEDPRPVVRAHVQLVKPGGKAIIAVPDYGGIYGRLQRWFDPGNLALHNLEIMTPETLASLAPTDLSESVRAYRSGRLSPWHISFARRWPRPVARAVSYALNALALLQPVDIAPICPLLVVEITRRRSVVAC
jgi:2-polyprenyl-3-methyl-5-hydroxy-6-metoxy-1,4-benzoquinol methylase